MDPQFSGAIPKKRVRLLVYRIHFLGLYTTPFAFKLTKFLKLHLKLEKKDNSMHSLMATL